MFRDSITKIEIVNCDDSGSDVSRRFDYQLACVFLTFLTLSNSKEDFAVVLERSDDFLIIEDVDQPNECISLVQVKTKKDGPFTMKAIIKNKWIEKQASNYVNFVDSNVKSIFLTNFGIKVNSMLFDDTSLKRVSELPDCDEKNDLVSKIQEVLNGYGSINDFYILKGTLSLDGYKEQLKGHLIDYINRTVGGMNSETIETVYKTIWNDLHVKQATVLNEEEKKDYRIVLEKKGVDYFKIKEIVGISKSIEIPEKKDISLFYAANPFCLGEGNTIVAFLDAYQKFRTSSPTAVNLLEECRKTIIENEEHLAKSSSAYSYSELLLDIFNKSDIISKSAFYESFKYPIIGMFTYKMFVE